MKKYVLMVIIFVACLFSFCTSAEAAAPTTTTVTSLMNVLAEQKQQAVYNIKLNAPFSKGNSGIKESVDPETGEIIVSSQVVSLPGRNGQDLNLNLEYRSRDAKLFEETTKSASITNGYGQTIIVFYDVFDANGYWLRTGALSYPTGVTTILGQTTINTETWVFNGYLQYASGTSMITSAGITNATRAKSLVEEAKYAFGVGWSLDIPYLTIDGDNVYAHLPNGKTYKADFGIGVGLKDYELTDIVFTKDTTYSNGTDASAYKLRYANGQAYYFTAKGELLCQKDRFNNTIVYYWTDNSGKRLLTKISDSIGRVVDIEYNDNQILFRTKGKTIKVLRTLITGQTNKYYLSAYIDPAGRKTTYSYSLDTAAFDSVGKTAANNQYANLTDIIYPTGARTRYLFTKGTKNLGSSGYMEYYKVKERWDVVGVKTYNHLTYKYSNEPDGYPQYKVSAIDDLYKYSTSLIDSNGVVTTTIYNDKHFPCLKTVKADRLLSETRNDYNSKYNLPNKVDTKTYNKNGDCIENIDLYEYDHRGNLVMENHPENIKKINTDDHKAWYTYDYEFNLLTDKKYKKDTNTTVEIKYGLSDDKKTTASEDIYSNKDLISAKKYTYDDYGNTISQAVEKEPGEWVTSRFEYDPQYKGAYLTEVIAEGVKDANGNTKDVRTESQYDFNTGEVTETKDGNGNITQYQYDQLGRVTKEILPDKNSRTYDYDDTNNILKVTNANHNTLTYSYDALGKLNSVVEPEKKTVLVKQDYDEQEKLISRTDGNKNIQSIIYDEFGRISKVRQVDESGQVLSEKKVAYDEAYYDKFKNSFLKIEVTTKGNSKDNIVRYYFDRYERMAKQGRINGEKEEFSSCTYDFLGNQIQNINFDNTKTTYQYDALGQLLKVKDALGNNTSYQYDRLGKTISTINPLGQKSYFDYDSLGRNTVQKVPYDNGSYSTIKYFYDNNGNLIETIDPEGSIIKQQFNSRNFLTSVEQVISASKSNITEAEYDAEGNLTKVRTGLNSWVDPDYAVNTYHYDNLSRLITSKDNSGQSTSYDYDANSNLTKTTDHNNISTYYTYDGLNRVIKKQNNKDGAKKAIAYTYDLLGNCTRMNDPSGTTLYKYDQLGRLNTIDYSNGIRQYYSYDKADRINSFQIKQGSVTEMDLAYSYDQLGRLIVVKDQGKAYSYQYDAAGKLTKEENGVNGISTDYTYYDSGNIKSLNHFSGDNSLLDAYSYRYDKRGNQVEKIENGDVTRYYYDALSRLKTSILPDNTIQNYEFDDLNNIKSMAEITKVTESQSSIKETTYNYDCNNRLLLAETKAGDQTEQQRFTYDNEGNQLTKEENTKYQGNQIASKEYTYQYNGYNQLSRVIDPNQKMIEYTYNGQGLRTKKDFIDHATQYYYSGQNIVLETDQNSKITAKNVRGNQLISRQTDTQSFYYLHNAHGDVTALTDKFGKVIKDYSYDPYGNEKTNQINLFGKNATTELWRQEVEQVDNPFRYCGEYMDEETGNVYLRARYYDPELGRFISEDSVQGALGNPQTLNLYTYCANNPIAYIDPSGCGYVWNNYGEIIGTTPGNDYTDTSKKATDTHGGGDMMYRPWKIDNSDSFDCYLNTIINGKNVLDVDYIRQACIQCGVDEGLVSLLLGYDAVDTSPINVNISTIYSGSLPLENLFKYNTGTSCSGSGSNQYSGGNDGLSLLSSIKNLNHQIQPSVIWVNDVSAKSAAVCTTIALGAGVASILVVDAPITVPIGIIAEAGATISGGVNLITSASIYWDNPNPKNQTNLVFSTFGLLPGMAASRIGESAGLATNVLRVTGDIINVPATYTGLFLPYVY